LYLSAAGDAAHTGVCLAADAGRMQSPSSLVFRPDDLQPFTRVPLALVVDSNASHSFQTLEARYNEPLLLLLSPEKYECGEVPVGLFTLFLTEPVSAFCFLCGLFTVDAAALRDARSALNTAIATLVDATPSPLPCKADVLLSDPFLRTLAARFLFCKEAFSRHFSYAKLDPSHHPLSVPELDSAFPPGVISSAVTKISNLLGAGHLFNPPFSSKSHSCSSLPSSGMLCFGSDTVVAPVSVKSTSVISPVVPQMPISLHIQKQQDQDRDQQPPPLPPGPSPESNVSSVRPIAIPVPDDNETV